ncbi:MAG: DNRLRE domain-containing protein [Thermodesulfobacteriota bacterium]|nr:DNRLRE domain-containing protein [Thermodesulfobacteriota bacterium]
MKKFVVLLLIFWATALIFLCGKTFADEITCPDIADIYIDEWYPDTNFNYKTRMLVATNTNLHHGISRSLFRFDIPDDLDASEIKRAAIYLSACSHCGGGNGGLVGFYALNEPFDEENDTWNTLDGGDWDNSVYSGAVLPEGNSWNQGVNGEPPTDVEAMDITALLTGNLEKARTNGIMMRFQDEHIDPYTHQNVASRESEDPFDFPPFIIITTKEGEPPCPAEAILKEDKKTIHLLRSFRDLVLSKTPEGKNYIRLYYENVPEISRLLLKDYDLMIRTRKVLKRLLPAIKFMVEGKKVVITRDLKNEIKDLMEVFLLYAGPQLKEDIDKFKTIFPFETG